MIEGVLGSAIGDEVDPLEAADVPEPFVAVDEKVYWVPFVRLVIVHEVAGGVTRHVRPPGCAVTV